MDPQKKIMVVARFIDEIKCNINIDSDCDVYPLSHPFDSTSLQYLSLNWLA